MPAPILFFRFYRIHTLYRFRDIQSGIHSPMERMDVHRRPNIPPSPSAPAGEPDKICYNTVRVTDQAAVLLALCQRLDSGSIASFPLDVRLPHSPEGIPGLGKHLMKPNKVRSVPCTGNPLPHPAIPPRCRKGSVSPDDFWIRSEIPVLRGPKRP